MHSEQGLSLEGNESRTHLLTAHLLNELQPLLDVRLPFLPLHQCLQASTVHQSDSMCVPGGRVGGEGVAAIPTT